MSEPEPGFEELMQEVQRGSQEAAWQLIDIYGPHVQRYVRRSLNGEMRSKFDSLDFAQIVWASFFREPARIRHMTDPRQLMAYLASMARNKVVEEFRRRMYSQKRNVRREVSIEEAAAAHCQLRSSDPTPSAVAVARERWNRMVDNKPHGVRRIIEMRFQGATFHEIAAELKISERTARRTIAELIDEPDDIELVDAEVN